MNTLSALADREEAIRRVVQSQTGLMEEKGERLSLLGVFAQYQEVFQGYLSLLSDQQAGLEALKRALFLGWYDLSEPACFTGVLDLGADGRRLICDTLDSAFAKGATDDELRWMVPYYYLISDFAFPDMEKHPALALFLSQADPNSCPSADVQARSFEGRGLMGHYWLSHDYVRRPKSGVKTD